MPRSRRFRAPRCKGCGLLDEFCLCADLTQIDVSTQVVVSQHPNERHRTSNTGRLVPLTLKRGRLIVSDREFDLGDIENPVVLIPDVAATPIEDARDVTLIVPDGTWSEARRLARRSESLRDLPRVALGPCSPTMYRLRNNPNEDRLCTYEAIAHALGAIEGEAVKSKMLGFLSEFMVRGARIRGLSN